MPNNMSLNPIPLTPDEILREVFDLSSEGFQVIGEDWTYLYVNNAVANQGKNKKTDLIGHTMMEKYPGIENTPLFSQLKRCMDEKVSIRMENEFVFPDKTKGWFLLFIHPWVDGIMIFSVDITARKIAEEQLAKKIYDLDGAITESSEAKAKLDELKQAVSRLVSTEPVVI